MKRKLLAVAVASACATPAFAQVPAEIQVYGRVNVSVEHITIKNSPVDAENDSTNELVDNSSRIGFRGNKDLGGGPEGDLAGREPRQARRRRRQHVLQP